MAYTREFYLNRKQAYFEGKVCVQCGSTNRLEIDHINPQDKEFTIRWTTAKHKLERELSKCQVLCHECHTAKTQQENRLVQTAEGTAFCNSCERLLPIEQFHKNNARSNGLTSYCKSCRKR